MLDITYPGCVLLQVTSPILDGVRVAKLLQELHLFNDVLPFLHVNTKALIQSPDPLTCYLSNILLC